MSTIFKKNKGYFFSIVLGKMIKDFKVIIKNFFNIIITNILIIQLYIYNLNLHLDKNNIYFYDFIILSWLSLSRLT